VASDGTLTVNANEQVAFGYDFHCGGYINSGSGHGFSAYWSEADETLGDLPYCVDGDTLWIHYESSPGIGSIALEFRR
jgi:hypothetical protein